MPLSPTQLADRPQPHSIRISPDGTHVVYALSPLSRARKTAVSSLRLATLGVADSARQITDGTFHDTAPEFSPDGKCVAFLSDRGCEGVSAGIWLLRVEGGGEAVCLTGDARRKEIYGHEWSPDGRHIAFTSADEDSAETTTRRESGDDAHVWGEAWEHARLRLLRVKDRTTTTLLAPDAHVSSFAWRGDGAAIAYTLLPSPSAEHMVDGGEVCVLDVHSGVTRKVHRFETWVHDLIWWGEDVCWVGVLDGQAVWSADAVWRWREKSGRAEKVAYGEDSCARGLRVCGGRLVAYVQQGLVDALEVLEGERVFEGRWDIAAGWDVHATGGCAVVKRSPAGEEVVSIVDGVEVQLSSHGNISPEDLHYETLPVETTTDDGLPLDGLLYLPTHAPAQPPYPAVVIPHGGPYWRVTAGTDPTLFAWTPWLLSLGYAVLLPNFRGGAGHGWRFAETVVGDPAISHADVVAFTAHCVAHYPLDARRVAIAGWSHGGYLAYLALTQPAAFPFAAGIAGAAPACWDTLVLTSDVPTFQGALTGTLGWETPLYGGAAGAGSPLKLLDRMEAPLLILHGEEDVRVPVAQACAVQRVLRARGRCPQMVVYPREGHAGWERAHVVHMLRMVEGFLRRCVPVGREGDGGGEGVKRR